MSYTEVVDQNLCACSSIHLTDTTLNDNDICIAETSFTELHTCDLRHFRILKRCLKLRNFFYHCANNTNFHYSFSNLKIRRLSSLSVLAGSIFIN